MATFQYLDEGNSEAQDRLATSFLLAQASVGLARTGVLSGLAVTQTTTASGAVLVAAGAAPVQASVGTGVALLVNDTQATLDVFTAHPVGGLPRNDIVAFDSVTKTVAVIEGDPNAAPTDPTVPATACALARLRHAASATTIPTAKIDDLRVLTALAGVAGAWTAYTATLTGFNTGSLTPSTVWRREGDLIRVRYAFVFGVSATAPTNPRFSLPIPSVALATPLMLAGMGGANRPGGASYFCPPCVTDTGTVTIANGSAPLAFISPTTPFTWTVQDAMVGELTYRPA